MQKLILGCLALCSLFNCLLAESIYAAISGLPPNFLPPPPPSSNNMLHSIRPLHLQDGHLARPQRSLYGPPIHGWSGPPVQTQSIGLGHISKQELITLLEAAKEVAGTAPEPEPELAPERGLAPGGEAGAGAGSGLGGGGVPAGVPLTVSLPAFVPIQLSAMYTAPPQSAAPAAPVAAAGPRPAAGREEGPGEEEYEEEEEDEDEEDEEEEEEEEPEAELQPAPGPIKAYPPIYHPWSTRPAFSPRPVASPASSGKGTKESGKSAKKKSKSKSRKAKTKKSKSKSKSKSSSKTRTGGKPLKSSNFNLGYANSAPDIQALPPPPFFARAPGPLKLVPSNQLLSNWK